MYLSWTTSQASGLRLKQKRSPCRSWSCMVEADKLVENDASKVFYDRIRSTDKTLKSIQAVKRRAGKVRRCLPKF